MMQGAVNSAPQLTWTTILALMIIFGMFGGILDVLGMIDIRRLIDVEQEQINLFVSRKRLVAALVLGGIGGIGGAFAMLFVIVAAAKLDTVDTPVNKLLLASLGVVSGFLGFRVLRGVARGVERQIQASEARQEAKTAEQFRMANERTDQMVDRKDAIISGLTFVEEKAKVTLPSVRFQIVSRLERLRESIPDDREVTIVLGEVYKKLHRYDEAIKILTEFLTRIAGSGRDKDIADALYNRAVYYALKADNVSDSDPIKPQLRAKAYADLGESISLSAENKKDAAEDEDLKSLWSEERFKELIA